ncbi:hypothetical protein J2X57_002003 [Luteibacter sp. 1214]|uniref:hypothetical protein n=1 Tax=Luteibacter sp. 1214 TaxID=2817735 RepID=UPI0028569145|nr:hypothetical protein [Luteibacter sp. 1214]MDR6642791.1 hypothetical protein [Luteibacter sp. 1214]
MNAATTPSDSLTVKVAAGLSLRISYTTRRDALVISLFKVRPLRRGMVVGYNTNVVTFVADKQSKPYIRFDYHGGREFVLDGFFVDLPEASAKRIAAFLGIDLPGEAP